GVRLAGRELGMARDERDRLVRRVLEGFLADRVVQRGADLLRDAVRLPLLRHAGVLAPCQELSAALGLEERGRRQMSEAVRHVPAPLPSAVPDALEIAELDRAR